MSFDRAILERDWKDYYQILNVNRNATLDQIKEAKRFKSVLLSPDRMTGFSKEITKKAEEELKAVNNAFDILSDFREEYNELWDKKEQSKNVTQGQSSVKRDPHVDQQETTARSRTKSEPRQKPHDNRQKTTTTQNKTKLESKQLYSFITKLDAIVTRIDESIQVKVGSRKGKWTAILLTFFLGGIGIQNFYLGGKRRTAFGLCCLTIYLGAVSLSESILLLALIPNAVALFDFFSLLFTSKESFQEKYGDKSHLGS